MNATATERRSAPGGVPGTAGVPFWAWCVIAVFSTGLYTVAVPVSSAVYELDLVVAFVIATVQCGSLILAFFRPFLAAALHLAAVAALAVATAGSDGDPWPLPVTGLISLGALLLVLGIRQPWAVSVTTWWVSVAVLVAVIATSPARYPDADQWGTNLTVYATYTATVVVAAIAIGQRHRIRTDLAEARRDAELEHAQRRFVEERARIARELHDVVAHSMSLIHMQALSAPIRLTEAPREAVDAEFHDIARSARTALTEMRQLLSALRPDEDGAELVPQPQLADIPDLAAATSRGGVEVAVHIDPAAGAASPIVQLTAYRIVQEALSNVVRHAPGAPAAVSVRAGGGAIRVTVRNAPPEPTQATSGVPRVDRGGQGLRGMRERVTLLDGSLTATGSPDGGYLVDATIPAVWDERSETP
jgi:signal transduction histidine kinase